MDRIGLRKSRSTIDLERGGSGTSSEDDQVKGLHSDRKTAKKKLDRLRSGPLSVTGLADCGDELSSNGKSLISGENFEGLVAKLGEEEAIDKMANDRRRKKSSKRPPKPPKPPMRPTLSLADMKLVREMSELAKLKHARIGQMKELKKKRAEKASSCGGNLFAMVITILFFFVVISQGFCFRCGFGVDEEALTKSPLNIHELWVRYRSFGDPVE